MVLLLKQEYINLEIKMNNEKVARISLKRCFKHTNPKSNQQFTFPPTSFAILAFREVFTTFQFPTTHQAFKVYYHVVITSQLPTQQKHT